MDARLRVLTAVLVLFGLGLWVAAQEQPAPEEWDVAIAEKVLEAKPGTVLSIELPASGARLQGVRFKLPEGTKKVYAQVTDASADIDLWLTRERAKDMATLLEEAEAEKATGRLSEVMEVSEGLRAGTYYVYAGSLSATTDEEINFKLLITLNDAPPPMALPSLPFTALDQLSPAERAVHACVALNTDEGGGSGTVVTPGGLILTNRHVLENEDGSFATTVFVSFTRDPRGLPVQTHTAVVVEQSAELDVALLRIIEDLNGNPVENPNFAWLPLAPSGPEFGHELRCLGYPAIGGSGSVASITMTSGVVSGFAVRKGVLQWLKTDCLISAGNSGGAALNAGYELVGIPTESLHDPETLESLGYVRPVGAIPKAWLERIRKDLPK